LKEGSRFGKRKSTHLHELLKRGIRSLKKGIRFSKKGRRFSKKGRGR
jgi:hypothetical protein